MTTINKTNYFKEVKNIDFKALPDGLKEGFETIKFGSKDYSTWEYLEENNEFLRVYFEKLNKHLKASTSDKASVDKKEKTPSSVKTTDGEKRKPKTTKATSKVKPKPERIELVEKVDECIAFIKRYVNMNNQVKTKKHVLLFISALQKAITEKKIRKTSKYAKEIKHIQDELVKLYNKMREQAKIEIKESTFNAYHKIAYGQKVMLSVSLIKRFIGIQGKKDVKERAERLRKQMEVAVRKQQINRADPNKEKLEKIYT
ncbi:MAG: hypothetical protein HN381_02090, partial [Bacteroidetes bacterium]|nr:hypothetical protein [Bacteroidota bacterium]